MDDLISRQAVLALPRDRIRNMNGEIVEETIDVADIKALPSAQPDHDYLHPKKDPNFSSCGYCVHSEDSEEICILRRCVHAIAELKECYTEREQDDLGS